jgi:hypothetical protein
MAKSMMLAAVALQLAAPSAAWAAAAAANISADSLESRARPPIYADGWRCPEGFVWRNAGRQDWLCVEAFEADRIARENQQAPKDWLDAPDGSRECRSGLVRRDAFNNDPVCVDPVRRALVKEMNLALYNLH